MPILQQFYYNSSLPNSFCVILGYFISFRYLYFICYVPIMKKVDSQELFGKNTDKFLQVFGNSGREKQLIQQ